MKKMRKQFAVTMAAIMVLSVSMVPTIMSGLGDEGITNVNQANGDNLNIQLALRIPAI